MIIPEIFWKRKEVLVFALAVIVGISLFVGLITLRGRKGTDREDRLEKVTLQAKVMDQEYSRVEGGTQIPVGAALAYREKVPLYPRPTENVKNTDVLHVQGGREAGYVMESQVSGVRTNRDGSIWITLAWKDGKGWSELYAPSYYFQMVPGARNIPFFKDIKLVWEEPE
jgi:hypothetical protein